MNRLTLESEIAPELIEKSTVEAELLSMTGINDMSTGSHEFPYGNLSHREFELLMYSLFSDSVPPRLLDIEYDNVRLMNEGSDQGRDVVLYKKGKSIGVIQCKRYEGRISLPEVLREIIRFILFSTLHPHLICTHPKFKYILALASSSTETAADLFSEQDRILTENKEKIGGYIQEVINKYVTFKEIVCADVLPTVWQKLCEMKLHLLSDTHLNQWLNETPIVSQKFFPARLVIDSEGFENKIIPLLAAQSAAINEKRDIEDFKHWFNTASASAKRGAHVIATRKSGQQKKPVTLDSVYVTRTIEKQINQWIKELSTKGGIIAIIGPAGYGKSSLFWRLQTSLGNTDQNSCIALPPTEIFRTIESHQMASRGNMLAKYIEDRAARDQPTYVLFDTFDLLAHETTQKETTIALIDMLVQSGALILISSRPEELSQIALEDITPNCVRLYIEKYNDDEFAEAAKKYCAAFYFENLEVSQIEQHAEKLISVVSRKRPIREVCLGPLTLRMLFELYAPHSTPEYATAFDLYSRYWINKVQDDDRTGGVKTSKVDLSDSVMALAYQMLVFGTPSLTSQKIDQMIANRIINRSAISELFNRNLLVNGPADRVEFFHQTFFEYAAAKAMISKPNFNLTETKGAISKYKDNRLMLPVYEQVLLICAETESHYKNELDTIAHQLINDDHPALVSCAMFLHIYSSHGFDAVFSNVIEKIRKGNKSALTRYTQFLGNLRQNRVEEAVEVFKAAWKVSGWNFVEPALRILLWLSRNDWETCKTLIEEFSIETKIFSIAPSSVLIERTLIEILQPGIEKEAGWVGDKLFSNIRASTFHREVLEFLASYPSILDACEAHRLNSFINKLYKVYKHTLAESVGAPAAKILVAAWLNSKVVSPRDIGSVRSLPEEQLPLVLRSFAEPRPSFAADFYEALAVEAMCLENAGRLRLWLKSLFYPVLRKRTTAHPNLHASVAKVAEALFERFTTQKDAADRRNLILAKFFQRLFLSGIAFEPIANKLYSIESKEWLLSENLTPLLPTALCLEVPEATAALGDVCAKPESYPLLLTRLTEGVRAVVQDMADAENMGFSPVFFETLLELSSASKNPSAVRAYLTFGLKKIGGEEMQVMLKSSISKLQQLSTILCDPSYSKSKQEAYELLALLIKLKVLPAIDIHSISGLISSAADANEKLAAVTLLIQASQHGELDNAVSLLLDVGDTLSFKKQNRVIQALHSVLLPDGSLFSSQILDRISNFSFRQVDNEPRAHLIGKIILAHCRSNDVVAAHSTALRLIRDDSVRKFGATQKRTLAHHLDKTFQQLFNLSEPQQVTPYILELEYIDAHLGRLIVVALCKCRRSDRNSHLQKVLELRMLSADLKRVVQDYRRFDLA